MKEYKELLEKSIEVQIGIQKNLEGLRDNTKTLNDRLATHCVDMNDIGKEVKIIRIELMRWLKWAMGLLIAVLLILAGMKQLLNLI